MTNNSGTNNWMKWGIIVLGLLLIVAVVAGVLYTSNLNKRVKEAEDLNAQLQIDNEQKLLQQEFDNATSQIEQLETEALKLQNDTIFAKFTAAKQRVEDLQRQLRDTRAQLEAAKKAAKEGRQVDRKKIAELQDEINTLRNLLRHYVEQIDSLSKENTVLKNENREVRTRNEELSASVQEQTSRAEGLQQRVKLAEKLNVTGVGLTALNGKGKNEKNITKAKQLRVTFTIPQNNSTPTGPKTIFMRLTSPEGQLLGSAGSFKFEGGSLACSAKKTVDYGGDEIAGITMYWDVNTVLNPGTYTVELFTDGYRLCSRTFSMKK